MTWPAGVFSRFLRMLIVVVWAILMGRLLVVEVFPTRLALRPVVHRNRWMRNPALTSRWMRILLRGEPIGYSHTETDLQTRDGVDEFVLRNRTVLVLSILQQTQRLIATAEVRLNADQRLQSFAIALDSDPYRLRAEGRRIRQRQFEVKLSTAAFQRTLRVEIPDEAMLHAPLAEAPVAEWTPGRTVRLPVFDPFTLTTEDMTIQALRREVIEVEGRTQDAWLLRASYRGMDILSWVDREGTVLRQETPFGWTLELASARTALQSIRQAPNTDLDILAAASVPVIGGSPPDRSAARLVLRLIGPPALDRITFAFPRQTILRRSPGEVVLRIEAASERAGASHPLPAESLARARETTVFVPWDHPEIAELAAALAPPHADPLHVVEAIYEWVHGNLRKQPAISIPSALDVLQARAGDCNEHTYLFVALARARGLAARILVGLVPHNGAFYYHAWPAVHVGDWIELDPTLGLRRVGAAHIALAEGELEGQLALAALIGRLQVEVLDDERD